MKTTLLVFSLLCITAQSNAMCYLEEDEAWKAKATKAYADQDADSALEDPDFPESFGQEAE